MEAWTSVPEAARRVLGWSLFTAGETPFTVGRLGAIALLIAVSIFVARRIRRITHATLMRRPGMDEGVAHTIATFARYLFVVLATVAILGTSGLDLSSLMVVAGALGLGIGLGLQGIANDFVSGLVLLLERPIKIGDRIEVGELAGNVVQISPRATTIVTNDNIAMIVPNSQFISRSVVNWSHSDVEVRIRIPVGVAYHSDPEQVRRVLLAVADACPGVLRDRPPDVLFEKFGDSALEFCLRVWTRDYASRPGVLKSDLNFAILRALREAKIEIPFPQRDVHIRDGLPPRAA